MSDDEKGYGEPEKSGDDERISNLPNQKELEKELAEYLSPEIWRKGENSLSRSFPSTGLEGREA